MPHVKDLAESFRDSSSVNDDIAGALLSAEALDDWAAKRDAGNLNMDTAHYTVEELRAYNREIHTIAGDHSVLGQKENRDLQPLNEMWKTVFLKLYAADPHCARDMRMLVMIGNQSNQKNKTFLEQDFPQIIDQMYRRMQVIREMHERDPHGYPMSMVKEAYALIVKDIATTKKINMNTLGAWMQLAKQAPVVYDKMHAILTGKFTPQRAAGVQPPRRAASNTHFSVFVSLNFWLKKMLLDKVLAGDLDTKGMHQECKYIKARQRLRKEIALRLRDLDKLKLVVTAAEKKDWDQFEEQSDDYCVALAQYPWVEKALVTTWFKYVADNVKMKHDLPREIFSGLGSRVANHEAGESVRRAHKHTAHSLFSSFCHWSFTLLHSYFGY
jgi:hypothetical protein